MEIKLNIKGSAEDVHICVSRSVGHVIIFTCDKCPNWEKRFNTQTGKMEQIGTTTALHSGKGANPNILFNQN